jgi:hypothetical protein
MHIAQISGRIWVEYYSRIVQHNDVVPALWGMMTLWVVIILTQQLHSLKSVRGKALYYGFST